MTMHMLGEVRYAPSRDIVYLLPDIMANVADRLEDEHFSELHSLLKKKRWFRRKGITMDDLGEACKAYITFMKTGHEDPDKNIDDVLRDAGWYKVKPEARIAYTYYVGAMMSGTFFRGIRDVTPERGETISQVKDLRAAAEQMELVCRLGWFRRVLYRWSKWYRRITNKGRSIHKEA